MERSPVIPLEMLETIGAERTERDDAWAQVIAQRRGPSEHTSSRPLPTLPEDFSVALERALRETMPVADAKAASKE